MNPYLFLADIEVFKELLPLGDTIIGGIVTLATGVLTYFVGRKRSTQEVDNLKAEKRSVEATAFASNADAIKTLTESASAMVGPLTERLRVQSEEMKFMNEEKVFLKEELERIKTEYSFLKEENERLKSERRKET